MLPTEKRVLRKKSGGLLVNPARQRCLVPLVETSPSPFEHEFHTVQGTGFRCLAYRNGEGKWRAAFDNEELPGEVRVLD